MSIPKTAEGRSLPIYCMYLGVSLFSPKTRKGRNRVVIVPRTQRAIVIICWLSVMFHSSGVSSFFLAAVRIRMIAAIVGSIKESGPNMTRQRTETPIPISEDA